MIRWASLLLAFVVGCIIASVLYGWVFAAFVFGAAAPKLDIEGELEIVAIDYPDRAEYEYHVKDSKGQRHRIKMPASYKHDQQNLKSGKRVKVRGVKVKTPKSAISPETEALAVESIEVQSVIDPYSIGVNRVLVMVVSYSNQQNSTTAVQARELFRTVINPFFQQQSTSRLILTGNKNPNDPGDFVDTPIALGAGGCDTFTIQQQARDKASQLGYTNVGSDFPSYHRFVYLIPHSPCGWAGLGTVGWYGGFAIANGEYNHRVISHELGHNLGLWHSGCAGGGSEYCDPMDVMGNQGGSMGAWNRERLGWLNHPGSPPVITVTASGDYSIRALDIQDGAAKALKIAKPDGVMTYYVTLRNGTGFSTGKPIGVFVHQGPSAPGQVGPGQFVGGPWDTQGLVINQPWQEGSVPIWLTLKSQTATDAVINVSLTGSGGAPNAPVNLTVN